MKRLLAFAVLVVVASCSTDSYPLPSGPGSSITVPTRIGTSVPNVVIFMEPRPGDRIEFVSAEPVGTLGDMDVRFHFSPPVINADGSRTVGERLEQLAGASINIDRNASSGPENTVGIVAELTPHSAGTFTLANVRLHYRLNGGSEQVKEGVSVVFTICAADPAPVDCEESPAP